MFDAIKAIEFYGGVGVRRGLERFKEWLWDETFGP
jgi:hypothetical protein